MSPMRPSVSPSRMRSSMTPTRLIARVAGRHRPPRRLPQLRPRAARCHRRRAQAPTRRGPLAHASTTASTASPAAADLARAGSSPRAGPAAPTRSRRTAPQPALGAPRTSTITDRDHVSTLGTRLGRQGSLVHESRELAEVEDSVSTAIPVTTVEPARSSTSPPASARDPLDLAIDNALRRNLTTLDELHRDAESAWHDEDVRAPVEQLRARSSVAPTTTRSRRARQNPCCFACSRKHGLPAPVPQYEIRDARRSTRRPRRLRVPRPQDRHRVRQLRSTTSARKRSSATAHGATPSSPWAGSPITATANDLRNGWPPSRDRRCEAQRRRLANWRRLRR